jgi:hypothetical protein
MLKIVRLAPLALLLGAVTPAHAQTTETYSAYVLGLPAAASLTGTEKMWLLQGTTPKTTTPGQILSAITGDCANGPAVVCTKTNGVPFAPSATIDTTNASHITSGTLAAGNGGAGTINGALKGNGSGVVSQAACADLSNAAASCSTDATNATNIGSGTLNTLRLPAPFTSGTASGTTSKFMTGSGTLTNGHLAGFDVNGNIVDGGAAGAGTVTSVTCGTGLSGGTFTTTGTCATSLTSVTNSLGADVLMNNTSNYFDGPSTAQGTSGTWFATGAVIVSDTGSAPQIFCKLWDGTTVIASTTMNVSSTNASENVALSGVLASPAGNIRISCKDTVTTGVIRFNQSGNSKDSTLTVIRIQ